MNIMMDHNFFESDPWQTETYAPTFGSYMSTRNNGAAEYSCNSLLGFGLPAATGNWQTLRGQVVAGTYPQRPVPLLRRHTVHAGAAARERQLQALVLRHPLEHPVRRSWWSMS